MINEIYLKNGRNKIIKLFEDKYIKPTDFPLNAKLGLEPQLEYEPEYEQNLNQNLQKLEQKEQNIEDKKYLKKNN